MKSRDLLLVIAGLGVAGILPWMLNCGNPVEHETDAARFLFLSDTAAAVGDTVCLFALATKQDQPALAYRWSRDGGTTFDTAGDRGTWCTAWQAADTGMQTVIVQAIFSDHSVSGPETIAVQIDKCRPAIRVPADTAVRAGDSITLHAGLLSHCEPIIAYLWSFDGGGTFSATTSGDSITRAWPDTGLRTISVKVRDAKGAVSALVCSRVRAVSSFIVCLLPGDTTIGAGDSLLVQSRLVSHRNQIAEYRWLISGETPIRDTTARGSYACIWPWSDSGSQIIVLQAADIFGNVSVADTMVVRVNACIPELQGDSVVRALDTVRFALSTCKYAVSFVWSFDSGKTYCDTTARPNIIHQFALRDTGWTTVAARMRTPSGELSPAAYARVHVIGDIPVIRLPADTSISVNDTFGVRAQVENGSSTIDHFLWNIDGGGFTRVTAGCTLAIAWPPAASGAHRIATRAVDSRGVSSLPDSMVVSVRLDMPTIHVPHDTVISSRDTLDAVVSASDANGAIVRYLWNFGGMGWDDSTTISRYSIAYSGTTPLTVMVGARDDDGLIAVDSFAITFNRPPVQPVMISPVDTAIMRLIDSTFFKRMVRFSFTARDPDGTDDTLTFRLFIGKNPGSLTPVYEGTDTFVSLEDLDTGSWFWLLSAVDRFGDSTQSAGSFACIHEQTICFAGHSIMAGMGGDYISGGTRKTILRDMRAHYSGHVKSVGPLLTGWMDRKEDDSCFALSSSTAGQMMGLLVGCADLNADTWIIMEGINAGYTATELSGVMNLIQEAHRRNPSAAIYVLGGMPYPDVPDPGYYDRWYYYRGSLGVFNAVLQDTAQSKSGQGWDIHYVNVYDGFMTSDSTRNAAWFADEIHPNQTGYEVIARTILDSMGVSNH